MSLRYQISVRILLISLCIFLIGGVVGIWQARKSVSKEVESSINLALQLIKIGVGTAKTHQTDWMFGLNKLKQTRHLTIQLKKPSGEIINITNQSQFDKQDESPPDWFVNLVLREYPIAEYQIDTFNEKALNLIIHANPMDEIAEVWDETLAFLTSLIVLVLLTILAIHLVFDKTLQTIQSIVKHVKCIEKGKYNKKLPKFETREYDDIAKAINHLTDVLGSTQRQNKALTQHSLEIQEEERQRLSQELHDEFGQSLTAIKVMAVAAAHEKSDVQTITTSIIEICDHLMIVVRSMMKQLHPLTLNDLGLKATLEDLVHQWETRNTPTTFNLYCADEVDNINRTIMIQVYRVIQESLTNIIRHAHANHVSISLVLNNDPDMLHLVITDDGLGCNLDQMTSGFGLLGMEERIDLLGGSFNLQSQENKGIQIKIKIPYVEQ